MFFFKCIFLKKMFSIQNVDVNYDRITLCSGQLQSKPLANRVMTTWLTLIGRPQWVANLGFLMLLRWSLFLFHSSSFGIVFDNSVGYSDCCRPKNKLRLFIFAQISVLLETFFNWPCLCHNTEGCFQIIWWPIQTQSTIPKRELVVWVILKILILTMLVFIHTCLMLIMKLRIFCIQTAICQVTQGLYSTITQLHRNTYSFLYPVYPDQ